MTEERYGFAEIEEMINGRVYKIIERIGIERIESLAWVSLMTWERGKDYVEVILRTSA